MRFGYVTFAMTLSSGVLPAQSGSFVATLGSDTMHVERFAQNGNRLEGVVVTRSPATRIARWTAELDARGQLVKYEVHTTAGDGSAVAGVTERMGMTWNDDSLIRDMVVQGQTSQQRFAVPPGTVPGPSLPYLGVSYLMHEIGFRAARTRPADSTGSWRVPQVFAITRLTAASPTRVWFVGADSAEMDYFGQARSGWKFGSDGRLLRADWRATTYRYQIVRTTALDVDAMARAWTAADARGLAMGALSPRDSARGRVGSLTVSVDYSRPLRRGRIIWGQVVPWNSVWRLGADVATHITFSAPAKIGGVAVPAGSYTLWMLPSETEASMLVLNKRIRIFGTQYNASEDFARIPLERSPLSQVVDRLTLAVEDDRLWIRWGDAAYSVTMAPDPSAPVVSLRGTYQTAVSRVSGTCDMQIMDNPTEVDQPLGPGSLTLRHAGTTYGGPVDASGRFSFAPKIVRVGDVDYNLSVQGTVTPAQLDAQVTITWGSAPACRTVVRWVGPPM
jgi:hypothetical protein